MNNSCGSNSCSNKATPGKARCPVNGKEYAIVSTLTIKHQIQEPWNWHAKSQGYYFCDDPDCDVVYFGEDSSLISQSELRTKVGAKDKTIDKTVCYCFGVSMRQAVADENIKSFVIDETREHTCACETRNPSGRCCLKDFPGSQAYT